MTPSDTPPPASSHEEDVRRLIQDPRVRELLGDVLVEEIEAHRAPSTWQRVQPLVAGAVSALVTVLAFFLPSLQEQWDRWQSRQVIQRYVELGRDFMRDGRYKLAEETFAKAFELSDNKRLDIEEQRLAARVEQVDADPEWGKDNPEGIEEGDFLYLIQLQEGRGHEREQAATYNSYGVFLTGERRQAEAESAFVEAIRLDSSNATAFTNLGNLLSDRGEAGPAEVAYRRALRLDSLSVAPYYDLGLLLAQAGRFAEAENVLRRAVRLEPTDPDALRLLIEQLEKNGKKAEAAELLPRLAKLLAEQARSPRPAKPPSLKELEDTSE